MKRIALLLVFLSAMLLGAGGGSQWWLQDGGTGPRLDLDGDGLYDDAYLWDADGDGSPGLTLCTAKDVPYPQCKKAGEWIYPDGADDINCAIHGCGYGQMELTGTLRLPEAVVVDFPCWDVGAWDADANTPGACPAAGINDPRAACQTGGGNTRWDSSTVDATVLASCPVDADGFFLAAIAFQDWQGTIQGTGVQTAKTDTGLTQGRTVGTTIAVDTGNADIEWFSTSGYRSINFGRWLGSANPIVQQVPSGGTAATGDSKGWGRIRQLNGAGAYFPNIPSGGWGQFCVCDSKTGSCDGAGTDLASADDWVDNLLDGDTISLQTLNTPANTVASAIDLVTRSDGSTRTQGNCGTNMKQLLLGGVEATGTSGALQTVAYGVVGNAFPAYAVAPRSSYYTNRTTMKNVTVEPQDWYGETGGDCSKTSPYVDADATSRDDDCDTHLVFGMFGGGENHVENTVVKNWHRFAIDGDTHVGKTKMRDMQFWYGHGWAFTDDSFGWEWERTTVRQTHFTGGIFGGFFSHTNYSDLDIRDSYCSQCITFGTGNSHMTMRGLRFYNVEAQGPLIKFGCGAKNNVIDGVEVYGRRTAFTESKTVEMECASAYDNTGSAYCDDYGMITDRGGSTDRWCDNRISGNVLRDIIEYPPGPDIPGQNSLASFVTPNITLTNRNTFRHCEPVFLNNPGGTLTVGGSNASTFYYSINPTETTIALAASRTTCGTPLAIGGTVGTAVLRTTGGDAPNIFTDTSSTTVTVLLDATDGQEEAIAGNVFDHIVWNPMNVQRPCQSGSGTGCSNAYDQHTLFAVDSGAEEVLLYNTIQNSMTNGGIFLGSCSADVSGYDCPDVGRLTSYIKPLGTGNMDSPTSRAWTNESANQFQVRFCGDMPNATTTYFAPMSAPAANALEDPRPSNFNTARTCAKVVSDSTTEATANDAIVATGSGKLLSAIAGTCKVEGDVLGNTTFQLREDVSDVTGATCTITASGNYDSFCSFAVTVAPGAEPVYDTAGSLWAVAVSSASNESANVGYCDIVLEAF